VIDQAGDVIGLISFSTVQSSGESGAKYLRTIDDIKAALASAGVTPARGPVDDAFSAAMELYWGNHFTAAVPALQRVLDVYPGHPLATQTLALAQAKVGTAEDVPVAKPSPASSSSGGGSTVLIVGIAAAAIIIVGGLVLVSRRKKGTPAPAVSGAVPPPLSAVAAPPPSEAGRSVGFQSPPAATSPTMTTVPPPEPRVEPPAPPPEPPAPPVVVPTPEATPPAPAESHFCSSCGHALKEDARFCPSCGHPVED
jgi:hypothetical protein